eukprot:TRINITY_DN4157_c0_g1_i3.p1 TRINITY_DN4157_c0_g1~~TRINITY_DN4157_c0_g1_i3.p1  ORF type:complete len:329 (-),score=75.22 TRINITY_DN4157_c0_g1_i3:64-951(-)
MAKKNPKFIDGIGIAKKIRKEVKADVEKLLQGGKKPPGIGVVLVGDRPDSATYVRMKEKACKEVGINFFLHKYPAQVTEQEIVNTIQELNKNDNVHGILVQLPLSPHINEKNVLEAVSYEKDVDGFHPMNIGHLAMKGHQPKFIPCTPKGCLELLKRENIEIEGKYAVVLGRSNIVGIPMSLLLIDNNATVTVCHSKTKNIEEIVKQADIIVAAVGRAEMVKKEWIKPGAVVIDVGMNTIEDNTRATGKRLIGDVARDAVEVAGRITPVPGGVGPMTVAMLLQNTLISAQSHYTK